MNSEPPDSAAHQFGGRGVALIAAAGAVLLGAIAWFVAAGEPVDSTPSTEPFQEPAAVAETKTAPQRSVAKPEAAEPTVAAAPSVSPEPGAEEPSTPLRALEARYRATPLTETRLKLVEEIAGWSSADAVHTLARLFPQERHPEIKLALLTNLSEIHPSLAPEARLAVLTAALEREARNVRSAALGALAQLDDPRATALILRLKSTDPDQAVREMAAALYRDRLEDAKQR